jgi:hypothetical protein
MTRGCGPVHLSPGTSVHLMAANRLQAELLWRERSALETLAHKLDLGEWEGHQNYLGDFTSYG